MSAFAEQEALGISANCGSAGPAGVIVRVCVVPGNCST